MEKERGVVRGNKEGLGKCSLEEEQISNRAKKVGEAFLLVQ